MLSFMRNGKENIPPITTIEFPRNHILSAYTIRIFTTSRQKPIEHQELIPSAIEAMINKQDADFSCLTTKIRVDISEGQRKYRIINNKKDFIAALEEIIHEESQNSQLTKKPRLNS